MAIKGIAPQGYRPSISTIKLDSGAAASALHGRSVSNGHPGALCCPSLSTVQTRQHFRYTPSYSYTAELFKGRNPYRDLEIGLETEALRPPDNFPCLSLCLSWTRVQPELDCRSAFGDSITLQRAYGAKSPGRKHGNDFYGSEVTEL